MTESSTSKPESAPTGTTTGKSNDHSNKTWEAAIIQAGYVIGADDAVKWANALRRREFESRPKTEAPGAPPPSLQIVSEHCQSNVFTILNILKDEVIRHGGYEVILYGEDMKYMEDARYAQFLLVLHETFDYLETQGENKDRILEDRHRDIPQSIKQKGKQLLEEEGITEARWVVVPYRYDK